MTQAMEESNLDEYNKVVTTRNAETVDAFSSCVKSMKAGEGLHMGECINVMTQAL